MRIYVCVCMAVYWMCIYILRRLHMVSPKFLIRISTKAGMLCMGASSDDREQAMCTGSRCSMSGLIVVYIYMAIYIYLYIYLCIGVVYIGERENLLVFLGAVGVAAFGRLIQDEDRYRDGMMTVGERNCFKPQPPGGW